MKKISTILLALIGLQVSINAEIIYFDKTLQREEFEVFEHTNDKEVDIKYREINNRFYEEQLLLGTIRLEEGEELRINNRKLTHGICCGNDSDGFGSNYGGDTGASFYIEINYDRFTRNERIISRYAGNGGWEDILDNSGLNHKGSHWPIEGPADIKVKMKSIWFVASKYDQEQQKRLYKPVKPELYARISFNKTLASYRADQNQLQALVLPKGVPGMSVIMESSDDLVNWTRDTLGPKPTANRPKFFRLRAVKE